MALDSSEISVHKFGIQIPVLKEDNSHINTSGLRCFYLLNCFGI